MRVIYEGPRQYQPPGSHWPRTYDTRALRYGDMRGADQQSESAEVVALPGFSPTRSWLGSVAFAVTVSVATHLVLTLLLRRK